MEAPCFGEGMFGNCWVVPVVCLSRWCLVRPPEMKTLIIAEPYGEEKFKGWLSGVLTFTEAFLLTNGTGHRMHNLFMPLYVAFSQKLL